MEKVDLMKTVGANLRRYRMENDITQDELAEKVGISTSFCANLERGSKAMSMYVLRDLADALGITADYLLYDNNELNENQHIKNINTLLKGRSDDLCKLVEQVVRLTINTYDKTEKKFVTVGDEVN